MNMLLKIVLLIIMVLVIGCVIRLIRDTVLSSVTPQKESKTSEWMENLIPLFLSLTLNIVKTTLMITALINRTDIYIHIYSYVHIT